MAVFLVIRITRMVICRGAFKAEAASAVGFEDFLFRSESPRQVTDRDVVDRQGETR